MSRYEDMKAQPKHTEAEISHFDYWFKKFLPSKESSLMNEVACRRSYIAGYRCGRKHIQDSIKTTLHISSVNDD